MGTRRFLRRGHPYYRKKAEFNGEMETGTAPKELNGLEIFNMVKDKEVEFGKKPKPKGKKENNSVESDLEIWKKKSCFWEFDYWRDLDVRHCLDGMHIIKNICESLVGLLLNIKGKTKDGLSVRNDMIEMGIQLELAPVVVDGKKNFLPPACYTVSKKKKLSFLECLKSIKVPTDSGGPSMRCKGGQNLVFFFN